jgi:hypothetical protein
MAIDNRNQEKLTYKNIKCANVVKEIISHFITQFLCGLHYFLAMRVFQ